MAQSSQYIANEAKGIHVALKESLQTGTPWDREVEFQRKRLRKQLLALLLTRPYEPESKDIENHLWMQTSYAFISDYKQRIATLDKPSEPHPQQTRAKNTNNEAAEHRRIIQRFRQFLAEEERFYIQLVARCRRTFGLDEIHSRLVVLKIIPVDDSGTPPQAPNDRNHNQFPPEDSLSWLPQDKKQRKSRLDLVTKLLISLGDIARYRELYNESGGRPKAGHEDGPPTGGGGRNKRGNIAPNELLAKARNYEKALAYYEQAKSITPGDGHAFHQLGILASYQKDIFGSIVFYHRALCVSHPHDMAADNLASQLGRSLAHWRVERENFKPERLTDSSIPLRIRVNIFEVHIAVLHSLWKLPPAQMDKLSPTHSKDAATMFSSLISQRILPIELISKTIVLTQGALWKHLKVRDRSRKQHEVLSAEDRLATESRIFSHLLNFHKVLLDEGKSQIEGLHPSDSGTEDLAQRITAEFRRTLPALRIASKWVRANLKYIQGRKETAIAPFWSSYSAFMRTLAKTFPLLKLPQTRVVLEEDIEMRGFAPLAGFMSAETARDSELHPNVEQLIRIADLIQDAYILAEAHDSPLALYGGYIVVKNPGLEKTIPYQQSTWVDLTPNNGPQGNDLEFEDDDVGTEATSDPGDDAIRAALSDDDIVWDPNPSPLVTPPMATVSPVPQPTTAQDLLNNVLGASVAPIATHPPLLFGSNSPGRAPSIWSTSNQTTWQTRLSPPLNAPAPLPQINRTLDRSPPSYSHSRQISHDYPVIGGMPTTANSSSFARASPSPPHVSSMPPGHSHQFLPSQPSQMHSMRSVPHATRYAYNNFTPLHPQLEYGFQHHARRMSDEV